MRHRICGNSCHLGNSDPVRLDNNYKLPKTEFWYDFLNDVTKNFKTIANYDGFDFHIDEYKFYFGVEPAYKYEDLQIICFHLTDKNSCYIEQGRAWGYYGSQCLTRLKYYRDYKIKSKFIRFVNKWYDLVKAEICVLQTEGNNEKY